MAHWLDKYLYDESLNEFEIRLMWKTPLYYCSSGLANETNYERVWGRIAIVNKFYFPMHLSYIKDVFYIVDKTNLTKWQKFKIKLAYIF